MSNCQPGELAVVVRNTHKNPCTEAQIGMTIHLGSSAPFPFGILWIESRPGRCVTCGGSRFFFDADLQPIRGPKQGASTPVVKERGIAA